MHNQPPYSPYSPSPSKLQIALEQERQGRSVIPVRQATSKDERIPLVQWALYQKRRATPEKLCTWWERWPDANPIIVTGAVSGIFGLDIDGQDGLDWARAQGLLQTFIVSHGAPDRCHIWLLYPGFEIRNKTIRPNVEVKGDGGTLPAPGAMHWSGEPYVGNSLPIADAPSWLLDELRPKPRKPIVVAAIPASDDQQRAYATKALENETQILAATTINRNTQLFKSTAAMAGFMPLGLLTEVEIEAALWTAAQNIGLTEREIRTTFRSGVQHGQQNPRDLRHLEDAKPHATAQTEATSASPDATELWWGANGLPPTIRAAMNQFAYPACAPVMELRIEAINAGLCEFDQPLSDTELYVFGQTLGRDVSLETIKKAAKQGTDYFWVVCPPILPTKEDDLEDNPPGQTTPKAAHSQNPPHRPAIRRRLAPLATIRQSLLNLAQQRILEKHIPHTNNDPTVAPIREMFLGSPEIGAELEAKYGALVDGQPELKIKLNAVRREFERFKASLSNLTSAPIPKDWKYRNASDYVACCARAIMEDKGGKTQYSKLRWSRLVGKSDKRMKDVLIRAGVNETHQFKETPVHSAADLPYKVKRCHKALIAYKAGKPVATFYSLEDHPAVTMFVEMQMARGRVVTLKTQVANKQVIAMETQPELHTRRQPTPKVEGQDGPQGAASAPAHSATSKRRYTLPRRLFYEPRANPAWRDRGVIQLIVLAGLPPAYRDPDTHEMSAYTPEEALALLRQQAANCRAGTKTLVRSKKLGGMAQ